MQRFFLVFYSILSTCFGTEAYFPEILIPIGNLYPMNSYLMRLFLHIFRHRSIEIKK